MHRRWPPNPGRRLARARRGEPDHMDHLVVGLYRRPNGSTYRFFAAGGRDGDELGRLVKGSREDIVPDPPGDFSISSPRGRRYLATCRAGRRRHVNHHNGVEGSGRALDREPASIQRLRRSLHPREELRRAVASTRTDRSRRPWRPSQAAFRDERRLRGTTAQTGVDAAVESCSQPQAAIAGFASDDARQDLLDIRREVGALGFGHRMTDVPALASAYLAVGHRQHLLHETAAALVEYRLGREGQDQERMSRRSTAGDR